jgi:glyoxylase-like metal-dependent hydrolase (beta-lactamase superfamily II)
MKSDFYLFPGIKDVKVYPALVFLIRAGETSILFDTGLSPQLESKIGVFAKFLHLERLKECGIESQFKKLGFNPTDLDCVINSHLHYDHCSNNGLFPGVPAYVQQSEFDCLMRNTKNPMFIKWAESCTAVCLNGDQVIHDGECTATVHATPGHSPGHQILTIEDSDNYLVFMADSCFCKDGNLKVIEVEEMSTYTSSKGSLAKINELIESHKDKKVKMFFSHDFNFTKNNETYANCSNVNEEIEQYVFSED